MLRGVVQFIVSEQRSMILIAALSASRKSRIRYTRCVFLCIYIDTFVGRQDGN